MSDDHDDPIAAPVETTTVAPVLVPPPRPARARRRHSRRRYRIRRAIALLTLVVIGFGAWFAWELWQPFTGSGTGAVVVTIPAGLSARQIGDLLARAGVIDSGFFFRLRVSLDGDPRLRDGRVTLRHGMSYSAAIGVLTSKPTARHPLAATLRITIPEGFRRTEIAVLAHERGMSGSYMRASRRARGFHPRTYGAPRHLPSLEGFLFPATYYVTRGEPAADLVSQQLAAF